MMMNTQTNPFIDAIFSKEEKFLPTQIDELLQKTDLMESKKYGMTALMVAMNCNHSKSLNLTRKQWDYLLEKSDLTHENYSSNTALTLYIKNALREKIILSKDQQKKLFNAQYFEKPKNKHSMENFITEVFYNAQSFQNIALTIGWVVFDQIIDDYEFNEPQRFKVLVKNFEKNKNQPMFEHYKFYLIEKEKRVLSQTLVCNQESQKNEHFKI